VLFFTLSRKPHETVQQVLTGQPVIYCIRFKVLIKTELLVVD
jgi:hypothetical protein